jgi:hypothetical protein
MSRGRRGLALLSLDVGKGVLCVVISKFENLRERAKLN